MAIFFATHTTHHSHTSLITHSHTHTHTTLNAEPTTNKKNHTDNKKSHTSLTLFSLFVHRFQYCFNSEVKYHRFSSTEFITQQQSSMEANAEGKAPRVVSQKCLNRRKRKLEQLTPEQLQSHELSADLQLCVKVSKIHGNVDSSYLTLPIDEYRTLT